MAIFKGKNTTTKQGNMTWLLIGGPRHGELLAVMYGSSVKVNDAQPLIPNGVGLPSSKHPMMFVNTYTYHRREVVVDGNWYYVAVQDDEDLKAIPTYELPRYFEEVGHEPFA